MPAAGRNAWAEHADGEGKPPDPPRVADGTPFQPVFRADASACDDSCFLAQADYQPLVRERTTPLGQAAHVGIRGWKARMDDVGTCCGDDTHVFVGHWDGHNGKSCAEFVATEDDGLYASLRQVGAHATGATSSSTHARSNRDIVTRYTQAYEAVDAEYLISEPDDSSVGATGATLWVAGSRVVVSWVGNAAVFLVRGNKAIPLTCTHSPGYNYEKARIHRAGGVVTHDAYLKHKNEPEMLAVARSFGDKMFKGDDPARHLVIVEPDITQFELSLQDSMVFMCTEALLACCPPQHIVSTVSSGLSQCVPLATVLTSLLRSCVAQSFPDTHGCNNLSISVFIPVRDLLKETRKTRICTTCANLYGLWTQGPVPGKSPRVLEDESSTTDIIGLMSDKAQRGSSSQKYSLIPVHESDAAVDTLTELSCKGGSSSATDHSAAMGISATSIFGDTNRARHYLREYDRSGYAVSLMAAVFLCWACYDLARGEYLGGALLLTIAPACSIVVAVSRSSTNSPVVEVVLAGLATAVVIPYDMLVAWGMEFWVFSCVFLFLLATAPARLSTFFTAWSAAAVWVMTRTIDEAEDVGLARALPNHNEHDRVPHLGDDWLTTALLVRLSVLMSTAVIGWCIHRMLTGMTARLDLGIHAVASLARVLQQHHEMWSPHTRFKIRSILHVTHIVDRSHFLGDALEVIAASALAGNTCADEPDNRLERRPLRSTGVVVPYDGTADDDEFESTIELDGGPRASGFRPKQCTVLTVTLSREWVLSSYHELHAMVMQGCEAAEGCAILSFSGNTATIAWNTREPCVTHSHQALSFVNTLQSNVSSSFQLNMALASGEVQVGDDDCPWAGVVVGKPLTTVTLLASYARSVGVKVVMMDKVYEANRSTILARPIDAILVCDDGERPKVVYELIRSRRSSSQKPNPEFTSAFSKLQQLKVQEARDGFRKVLEKSPGDIQARRLFTIASWLYETDCQYCNGASYYFRRLNSELEAFASDVFSVGEQAAGGGDDAADRPTRKTSAKHDIILRRQIRDAEAEANSGQLVAWGLMPYPGANPRDNPGQGNVPKRFQDLRCRLWCRGTRRIGIGAFGEVWLGMASDGSLVAIKSMKLPSVKVSSANGQEQPVEDLVKEVSVMHKLRHENVVSYMASSVVERYIMIVMEYMSGGSLNDLLLNFSLASIPPTSIQRYVLDITRGLEFLHSKDIIHRDMKPHNVLLLVDGQCKLADFGASAGLLEFAKTHRGIIGTPLYMAPEACKGAACRASDIWGLGIIICQLFTGVMPYSIMDTALFNPTTFMYQLAHGHVTPVIPASAPSAARDIAEKCLNMNPELRPTAAKILTHEFILT